MEEKRQRDHQLKNINDARKKERKRQKAIDAFIVESINEEQRKEAALNDRRKKKEKKMWKRILELNEIKKQKKAKF